MQTENAELPWDLPSTLFLEGVLLSREPSPRFGATLRACFYHCLITAKPLRDWLVIETEDGSLQLRGPKIEALLMKPSVRQEVRRARDEPAWEPRARMLQA